MMLTSKTIQNCRLMSLKNYCRRSFFQQCYPQRRRRWFTSRATHQICFPEPVAKTCISHFSPCQTQFCFTRITTTISTCFLSKPSLKTWQHGIAVVIIIIMLLLMMLMMVVDEGVFNAPLTLTGLAKVVPLAVVFGQNYQQGFNVIHFFNIQ